MSRRSNLRIGITAVLRRGMRGAPILLLLAPLTGACALQQRPPLRYSFDPAAAAAFAASQDKGKAYRCRRATGPMRDMSGLFKFYGKDREQAQVDRSAMRRYSDRVRNSETLKRRLLEMEVAYLHRPSQRDAIARCMVAQLRSWADADAMLQGVDENDSTGRRQAVLVAMWTGFAAANGFAMIGDSPAVQDTDRQVILDWLGELADLVGDEFTPRLDTNPARWLTLATNQSFWAGAMIGSVAALRDDERGFDRAMYELRRGLDQIDDTGALPRELRRGQRALHYQSSAATALAILIALADRNGERFAKADRDRIRRLAAFTLRAYQHPEWLAKRVGKRQDTRKNQPVWIDILLPYIRQVDPPLAVSLDAEAKPLRPLRTRFVALDATASYLPQHAKR